MRMRSRNAFTLIELVISIAIITTVAGVAAFRFASSTERARVQTAAERVAAMINDARTRARTTGMTVSLTFSTSPCAVEIKGISRTGMDVVRFDEAPYKVKFVSIDFAGGNVLSFSGRGRPASGGEFKLQQGNFVRTVIVDPETGHATIK